MPGAFVEFEPSEKQIKKLIDDAKNHPLGIEFLVNGFNESVAVIFDAHVFTVDAARSRLGQEKVKGMDK